MPGADHAVLATPLRVASPGMTAPGGAAFVGTALVPMPPHELGLVLVRTDGPAFSRSELWRLGEIGEIAGGLLFLATRWSRSGPSRRP